MPRDLPVSNGNLLVNFDLDYRIRDIYFPWIGQENHTLGHEFRFGLWVDGRFSWMGPEWSKQLRYRDDTLVTDVHLTNEALALSIRCQDAVDIQEDVYVRRLEVRDLSGQARDVRLFFSQDFHLYGHDVGDTAFFDPRTHAVVHYKHNRYFLVNCRVAGSDVGDYFSCGVRDTGAGASSWQDAEDGDLVWSPISWGFAESTVGVRAEVPAYGTRSAYYWIAAGKCYTDVAALNGSVTGDSPGALIDRTANYWRAWSRKESRSFADLPPAVVDLFERSLLILRSQIDNRGAILAANDSDIVRFGGDTYSYVWGRDGAYIAAALARAGYPELCRRFFTFCAAAVEEGGYLFQHHHPDGTLASNWHAWVLDGKEVLPIQEDSTALLLWALWIHYECSKDVEFIRPLYDSLVLKCADFLVSYRDMDTFLPTPSYDLWEERYGVHTYTAATVIAGLRAAARFARVFGDTIRAERYDEVAADMKGAVVQHLYHDGEERYARSGYPMDGSLVLDDINDVSTLALVTLDVLPADDERIRQTAAAIGRDLSCKTAIGGLARYQGDQYQRASEVLPEVPGNPWFIATLWLADAEIARAQGIAELHDVLPRLAWCADNALPSGVLAEQVHPLTGDPLSVSPLTWSHSAFVWSVLAYVAKFEALDRRQASHVGTVPSAPMPRGNEELDNVVR